MKTTNNNAKEREMKSWNLSEAVTFTAYTVAIMALPLWALAVVGVLYGFSWLISEDYSEADWEELRERTHA